MTGDEFLDAVITLDANVFLLYNAPGGRIKGKWEAPKRWPAMKASGSTARVSKRTAGDAVALATGNPWPVIDVDPRNGGAESLAQMVLAGMVPHVLWVVKTPGGGWHLWVDAPLPAGKPLPGIDVQSTGQLVIMPPTPGYRLLPAADWPDLGTPDAGSADRLRSLLRSPEKEDKPTTNATVAADPAAYLRGALDGVVRDLLATPEGGRNDALNKAAFRVGQLIESGLDREQAEQRLTEAALAVGLTPGETAGTIESGIEAGMREPQHVSASAPADVFDRWEEGVPHPIFDATPTLSKIRQAAHSRMVGSGAVLAYVLGRVLAEVSPGVMLPATIGSRRPLNLAVAVVGKSGSGKSSASDVSAEVLGINQSPTEMGIGSGEGMIEAYLEERPDPRDPKKKIKVLVDPPTRIFEIDEVEHLDAVGKRVGSSLLPLMRTALMGGALKSSNASAERRRSIQKNSYRLIMFVGIQPKLANVLLDETHAGMPQRFVWVSMMDRTLPDDEHIPEWPKEIDWDPCVLELLRPQDVVYPDHVKKAIRRARAKETRETGDSLEGHLLLTRLRVAAGLMFLHGEMEITDRWWDIAGHIIAWSQKEQNACLAGLAGGRSLSNAAKGKDAAEVEAALIAAKVEAARKALLAVVKANNGITYSQARNQKVAKRHRPFVREACDALVSAGLIKSEDTTVGDRKGERLWTTK